MLDDADCGPVFGAAPWIERLYFGKEIEMKILEYSRQLDERGIPDGR